jgi:hypothetical protein
VSSTRVPSGLHVQTRLFNATRRAWQFLADLESSVLRQEIDQRAVDRPVYVTSLPRSGTTILTEMLERHPDLTSHRYSDFPNAWTPYWRNYLLQRTRIRAPELKERAHGDRIQVSNDSPEAVEEVLWMHFFPFLHDADVNNVLDGRSRNSEFDRFYSQHILKLLAVRNAPRYLSKANYNLSRIRYILGLFPDARFLIPVRDPLHHVASLARQHARFTRASQADSRIPIQLAMSGHFEFGPQRTTVNFGDQQETRVILRCWREGRETEGWTRYWAATYRYLIDQLDSSPELRKACLLFRYEDLCNRSAAVIDAVLEFCELSMAGFEAIRTEYTDRLSLPDYYQPEFSPDDRHQIAYHCDPVNEEISRYFQVPA